MRILRNGNYAIAHPTKNKRHFRKQRGPNKTSVAFINAAISALVDFEPVPIAFQMDQWLIGAC